MNILIIAPLPPPITGQAVAAQALVCGIERDHRVEVVNLSYDSLKSGRWSLDKIIAVMRTLIRVSRSIRDTDLIYFTPAESRSGMLKDVIIYLICCKRLNRMFIHLHGGAGMAVIMGSRWSLLAQLNRVMISYMKGVIVLGDRLKPIYSGAVSAHRLHVVRNFADPELFISDAELASKHSPSGPLRVLFLSNLLPGKGHEELAEAFTRLPSEVRREFIVDFAGRFESDEAQIKFEQEYGSGPDLRVHGLVLGQQKRALLHRAHIFCLPTYYPFEGQPISILEAYAAGAAVITTDHAGIFDIFEPGANGWAVEKRSVDALQRVLIHVARSRNQIRSIGRHNLKTARRDLGVDTHLTNLKSVLQL